MNLLQFTGAREQFVLKASDCTRSLAEDTRHWLLYDLNKPRNTSVHDFQKRVNEIYLRDDIPKGIDPEDLLSELSIQY